MVQGRCYLVHKEPGMAIPCIGCTKVVPGTLPGTVSNMVLVPAGMNKLEGQKGKNI